MLEDDHGICVVLQREACTPRKHDHVAIETYLPQIPHSPPTSSCITCPGQAIHIPLFTVEKHLHQVQNPTRLGNTLPLHRLLKDVRSRVTHAPNDMGGAGVVSAPVHRYMDKQPCESCESPKHRAGGRIMIAVISKAAVRAVCRCTPNDDGG